MSESKACPFCGAGSARISEGEVLTGHPRGRTATQSMCLECGALGPEAFLAEGEVDYGSHKATAAWNRRAALASTPAAPAEPVANIESPFNACMHREHCKAWKTLAAAADPGAQGAKVPAAYRRRVDAAAEAMSEAMAFLKMERPLSYKFASALSGLRAIQATDYQGIASQPPTTGERDAP